MKRKTKLAAAAAAITFLMAGSTLSTGWTRAEAPARHAESGERPKGALARLHAIAEGYCPLPAGGQCLMSGGGQCFGSPADPGVCTEPQTQGAYHSPVRLAAADAPTPIPGWAAPRLRGHTPLWPLAQPGQGAATPLSRKSAPVPVRSGTVPTPTPTATPVPGAPLPTVVAQPTLFPVPGAPADPQPALAPLPAPVPLPATLVLMLAGIGMLAGLGRKRG